MKTKTCYEYQKMQKKFLLRVCLFSDFSEAFSFNAGESRRFLRIIYICLLLWSDLNIIVEKWVFAEGFATLSYHSKRIIQVSVRMNSKNTILTYISLTITAFPFAGF